MHLRAFDECKDSFMEGSIGMDWNNEVCWLSDGESQSGVRGIRVCSAEQKSKDNAKTPTFAANVSFRREPSILLVLQHVRLGYVPLFSQLLYGFEGKGGIYSTHDLRGELGAPNDRVCETKLQKHFYDK